MLVNLLDCCVSNLMPMPFSVPRESVTTGYNLLVLCNERAKGTLKHDCCSDHIRNLKVTVPKERWVLGWVGVGVGACVCVCV